MTELERKNRKIS
ncbi:hypothetical protein SPV_2531 [Streptococcus pneumoniae]|nr:hypothetical protein SPV_2531 [Streptococcus pneumoniae]